MVHKVKELFKQFFILESYTKHEHIKNPTKQGQQNGSLGRGACCESLTTCLVPRTHGRLKEGTVSAKFSPEPTCALFLPALRCSFQSKRSSPQCPLAFLPFQPSNLLLWILSFFNFCLHSEPCLPCEAVVLQIELFPLENQSSSFPV